MVPPIFKAKFGPPLVIDNGHEPVAPTIVEHDTQRRSGLNVDHQSHTKNTDSLGSGGKIHFSSTFYLSLLANLSLVLFLVTVREDNHRFP